MTETHRTILRGLGVWLATIVTGLVVYQTPPISLSEFIGWLWQPTLQGLLMAFSAWGLHKGGK